MKAHYVLTISLPFEAIAKIESLKNTVPKFKISRYIAHLIMEDDDRERQEVVEASRKKRDG